jgi:hypothetical protein
MYTDVVVKSTSFLLNNTKKIKKKEKPQTKNMGESSVCFQFYKVNFQPQFKNNFKKITGNRKM